MTRGTYTLLVELPRTVDVRVGALGVLTFQAGWYAYTGSAFGPGGLSRVDRHRELARGERDVRHWHVDYLLGHPAAALRDVVVTEGEDVECAVARSVGGDAVPGFGASDCDCGSHLARFPTRRAARDAVVAAHEP
ncbi:DUF123 domain-containing protein [Halobacteriaceae archaeon GCM10025711]